MKFFIFILIIFTHFSCLINKRGIRYYPFKLDIKVHSKVLFKRDVDGNSELKIRYPYRDIFTNLVSRYYLIPKIELDTIGIKKYNGTNIVKFINFEKLYGIGGIIVRRFGKNISVLISTDHCEVKNSYENLNVGFLSKNYEWSIFHEKICGQVDRKRFSFMVSCFDQIFWVFDGEGNLRVLDDRGYLEDPDDYLVKNLGIHRVQNIVNGFFK